MSSRNSILQRVAANKPPQVPLPQLNFATVPPADCLPLFMESFARAGGVAVQVPDVKSIGIYLQEHFTSPERVLNTVAGIGFGTELKGTVTSGHIFDKLEIAVLLGTLGVAENGAVWVSEVNLPLRVLPFICEHVALVLPASALVGTMHEAYARLDVAATGYGAFIAGPSRTADIEQSLVIGAHGPKRAHLFLVEEV